MFKLEFYKKSKLITKIFDTREKAIEYINKHSIKEYYLENYYYLEV